MLSYCPPVRDMQFVLHDLLNAAPRLAELYPDLDLDASTIDAVIREAGNFCAQTLWPLNAIGDLQGCKRNAAGEVSTPAGFKEAYLKFCEGGWSSLACDPQDGGQGLPSVLNVALYELLGSTNLAWAGYPTLSFGAYHCLVENGSVEQREKFASKLASGQWTGTMCLTEPHCGSDLGMIKTLAVPRADGTYAIRGTKTFISSGEHDLAENIVHLVLARIDGAPPGTKGISMFVVPKYLPAMDGLGPRNMVDCGVVESKMGIKGNATCELLFDGATGWLVGEPHSGLRAMFVMMNGARLAVGTQAVGLTDMASQCSLEYAQQRLQMRAAGGATNPDGPADPIIVHPDVRRMLLTQRAYGEGGRALTFWTAMLLEESMRHPSRATRESAAELGALLTPIVKAFLTDNACEAASLAVQVHGGHGYMCDSGVEQLLRDARILPIYEGTNGIQGLDLLGRKVLSGNGRSTLNRLLKMVEAECDDRAPRGPVTHATLDRMQLIVNSVRTATYRIAVQAGSNPEAVGAAAHSFLRVIGHLVFSLLWVRMARLAHANFEADRSFHAAKLATAAFYFERLLPEVDGHLVILSADAGSLAAPFETAG